MALILDTNGLSAMADGDPEIEAILNQAPEIAVPVVVLGEYKFGIRRSRRHVYYERWLGELLPNCRILLIDESTAAYYSDVRDELKRRGHPIPGNDLWIAALVRQHRLPLVSRDQHFDFVPGLKRLGW